MSPPAASAPAALTTPLIDSRAKTFNGAGCALRALFELALPQSDVMTVLASALGIGFPQLPSVITGEKLPTIDAG
jgi:hypothetical protein